jgi:hypothetical protein
LHATGELVAVQIGSNVSRCFHHCSCRFQTCQLEQTCSAAVTILLSKVSHEPYGAASATGLTNLLYEVAMPQTLDPACDLSTPEVLLWSRPPAERNIHTVSLFSKLTAVAVISILPLRLSTIVPGAFTGDTNHFQKVNTGET